MNKYNSTYSEISSLIGNLCTNVSFSEKTNPREAVYKIKDQQNWQKLLVKSSATNEIVGLSFYHSFDPKMPVQIRPDFMADFEENYFSGRPVEPERLIESHEFAHKDHWTIKHLDDLYRVNSTLISSLKSAFEIAFDMIKGESNMTLISGPIAGLTPAERDKNLENFDYAIWKAKTDGHNVFNPMPFVHLFSSIVEIHAESKMAYPGQILLDQFYFPLLETGKFKKVLMIPGWQNSIGANQERAKATKLGLEIAEYFPRAMAEVF